MEQAYLKIKLSYPKARHIMCAYFLPGDDLHLARGCCDDGEHGAGNKILDFLIRNDLENRAVFVIRYYSGKKIGPSRFNHILEAVTNCIQIYPMNEVLGYMQEVLTENEEEVPQDKPNDDQLTYGSSKQVTENVQSSYAKSLMKNTYGMLHKVNGEPMETGSTHTASQKRRLSKSPEENDRSKRVQQKSALKQTTLNSDGTITA